MRVAGVIAEYNPLHNGHVYHLNSTRSETCCDYVAVVMSGDYVQRGEPAVADKFTRAAWALDAGADIVLELPTVYAVASAERFAAGGVRVLAGTGVLTHLCFGSETADIGTLQTAADALSNEPPAFREALREQLSLGKSYPRARYDALAACGAPEALLRALETPNSILGVEYIRFLRQYAPQAEPVAIGRVGSGYHDQALSAASYSSATAIREALLRGREQAYDSVPLPVAGYFRIGGNRCVSLADAEPFMLYALRCMSPEEIAALPDVQEGFENVLYRAARQARTVEELYARIKSKRYTLARCKRICLCAMLHIRRQLAASALQEDAPYLRVLGFRRTARALVSAIGQKRTLPLVIRRADVSALPPAAQDLMAADIRAHELYGLLCGKNTPQADFSAPPIVM